MSSSIAAGVDSYSFAELHSCDRYASATTHGGHNGHSRGHEPHLGDAPIQHVNYDGLSASRGGRMVAGGKNGYFCYVFAKTLRLSCAERDMAYPYLPT